MQPNTPTDPKLIEVNGVALEVMLIGDIGSSAPSPIVFLHEGLGSVAMWRDWPAKLCEATGRAGIVYSRRGYGQSDSVPDVRGANRLQPDYMHNEALAVLPELLGRLLPTGASKPVLLGHSDGGTIALIHAAHHAVEACIVMAPHVIVEDVSVASIEQARATFEASPPGGGMRSGLSRYHRNVDSAFWQWNDVWLSEAFRSFDIRKECRNISAPVLAIQGVDDVYGTMAQIDDIHPAGRIERLKLPACGHSPHRDQPEVTVQAIDSFLRSAAQA